MNKIILAVLIVLAPTVAAEPLHIMLTNDDGIEAPGINAVREALLSAGYRVSVVAPAEQQSGASASTVSGDIGFSKRGDSQWAVDGRPANAVFAGLFYFLKDDPPDLVVAGANFGQNVGASVNFSGTVGAALTAFKAGIPVIAISVGVNASEARERPRYPSTRAAFADAGRYVADLINRMKGKFPEAAFLNINYPALPPDKVKGTRIAALSKRFAIGYALTESGRLRRTRQSTNPPSGPELVSDRELLAAGYVTISFLDDDLEPNRKVSKKLARRLRKLLPDTPS